MAPLRCLNLTSYAIVNNSIILVRYIRFFIYQCHVNNVHVTSITILLHHIKKKFNVDICCI